LYHSFDLKEHLKSQDLRMVIIHPVIPIINAEDLRHEWGNSWYCKKGFWGCKNILNACFDWIPNIAVIAGCLFSSYSRPKAVNQEKRGSPRSWGMAFGLLNQRLWKISQPIIQRTPTENSVCHSVRLKNTPPPAYETNAAPTTNKPLFDSLRNISALQSSSWQIEQEHPIQICFNSSCSSKLNR
jgi:hypothetical protein